MPEPVDLLLISWNRVDYLRRTLERLFAEPGDFRLHCWDNGSQDGAADLISEVDDPRLVARHHASLNLGQQPASAWFLERAAGDVAGKVDDDLLLPPGWLQRLAPPLRREPRFGALACWVYMPEDYEARFARRNALELSGVRLLRATSVGGAAYLSRTEVLRRFYDASKPGFPVDVLAMSLAGLVSGYPLPLLHAHHMDDPRSPYCAMRAGGRPAYTLKRLGFSSLDDYADWIAADARRRQIWPYSLQLASLRWERDSSRLGRIRRRALRVLGLCA